MKKDGLGIFSKIKKEEPVLFLYIFGNFFNAVLLRLFTTGHFQLRSIFFDLFFIMFMTAMAFLVNKKHRRVFYSISTFIMVAACVSNSLYYNYYKSFVSISLLSTSVFVKDVSDAVMDMVIRPCDITYFWILFALIIMYLHKNSGIEKSSKYFKKSLLISIICLAIGSSLPPYYAFSRLYKLWNRVSVLDSFGPYIYQADDIIQSLTPSFNNIFGYDKALKDTNEYYKENQLKLVKNEYSNIFEGKNVIAIHAESLQSFVIGLEINGEEVTPNINRIIKEGMYFSNFYAQVGVGTSSDTEYTYSTSMLPSNNGTVFVNYYNNKFVTIQNLLKDKGYYVFSMHGNGGDFWNREAMHQSMGYDKFYSKSSFVIDEEYGLGLSDASFFRQVLPMIKEIKEETGKPFYGTLITLTNHTPWRDADKFSDFDVTLTVDINGSSVKREYLNDMLMGKYLKSVNYMDKVLGEFFDKMEEEGLLEDTIVVIYGDHDAKIPEKQFNYLYNYDPVSDSVLSEGDYGYKEFNEYDYELSKKVPFIIWDVSHDFSLEVDKPMGMIDVLPTLGNMLGIYDKYALGKDIMSTAKEDAIVVFKDGSYITDKIYYTKSGEVYTITNGVINDDYIKTRSEYADKIIEVSNNVITYDLIGKLD